ncbi:hypothetical protein EYF80_007715 [Liparis tanakae]|uniref:Uncharacterized protein n=1 Tax=Liparis tanakae TaxID=230148 RepID=A0A4Z2IVN6_9TELE|nr:hypothetical protein EYF80_007715 [Liparis tanakae]
MTRKPSLNLTIRSLGPTLRMTVLSTVMGVQHSMKVDTIRRDILNTLFWRSRLSLWRFTALRKAMMTETEVRIPSVGMRLPVLWDASGASCGDEHDDGSEEENRNLSKQVVIEAKFCVVLVRVDHVIHHCLVQISVTLGEEAHFNKGHQETDEG